VSQISETIGRGRCREAASPYASRSPARRELLVPQVDVGRRLAVVEQHPWPAHLALADALREGV
jgi:hypothetical protein